MNCVLENQNLYSTNREAGVEFDSDDEEFADGTGPVGDYGDSDDNEPVMNTHEPFAELDDDDLDDLGEDDDFDFTIPSRDENKENEATTTTNPAYYGEPGDDEDDEYLNGSMLSLSEQMKFTPAESTILFEAEEQRILEEASRCELGGGFDETALLETTGLPSTPGRSDQNETMLLEDTLLSNNMLTPKGRGE